MERSFGYCLVSSPSFLCSKEGGPALVSDLESIPNMRNEAPVSFVLIRSDRFPNLRCLLLSVLLATTGVALGHHYHDAEVCRAVFLSQRWGDLDSGLGHIHHLSLY